MAIRGHIDRDSFLSAIDESGKWLHPVEREAAFKEGAASARKQLGVLLRPGLTSKEQTLGSFLFFAPSFAGSTMALLTDAARGGIRGKEARRVLGHTIMGGTALTMALQYKLNGELPELDPLKPGWMSVKVGEGYLNLYGPFYPYLRSFARTGAHIANGDLGKAGLELAFLSRGRTGIGVGTLIDFLLGEDVVGNKVEFSKEGLLSYFARRNGPIGLRQTVQPFLPTGAGGTSGVGAGELSPEGAAMGAATGGLAGLLFGGGLPGAVVLGVMGGIGGAVAGSPELRAAGAKQYERFPVRPIEILGGRTTPQTPAALMGESRVRGFQALQDTGKLPPQIAAQALAELKKSESANEWFSTKLGKAEKEQILAWQMANEPDRVEAYKQARREREDIFQIVSEFADARKAEDLPRYDALLKGLLEGDDPKAVFEQLDDYRNQQVGALNEIYEGDNDQAREWMAVVKDLRPSDMRAIETAWDMAPSRHYVNGRVDWEAVDKDRIEILTKLTAVDEQFARRFVWNLDNKKKTSDAHPILQLKETIDNLSQQYFDIKDENPEVQSKKRHEWMRSHPTENALRWLIYDGNPYDVNLESAAAVVQAVEAGFSREKRPVVFNGGTQVIDKTNVEVIKKYGTELDVLVRVPSKDFRADGTAWYPRTDLRKRDALYDALYFWLGLSSESDEGTATVYHLSYVRNFLAAWGPRQDGVRPAAPR